MTNAHFSDEQFEELKNIFESAVDEDIQKAKLEELVSQQMASLAQADKEARDYHESLQEQMKNMQREAVESLSQKRRLNQLPPEVQQIANLLTTNPALIPPVTAFIQKLSEKIKAALDEIVENAT